MDSTDALVARIAADCTRRGMTVAAIESLTSGAVASALGQGEDAAEWFAGGVVAYRVATKTSLLRVTEGLDPSTPECAAQLAAHGRELLAVDVCVAVTGVGGPEPSDGHPAGEVHLGLATVDGVTTSTHRFEGDPADVVVLSVRAAVAALAEGVTAQADAAASGTVARDARGEHDPEVRILPLRPSDAGEVLTIQRAAFVSEAQIYGSADMSPLTQTLAEVEAELEGADGWVARIGGRLVGVIRTLEEQGVLTISRGGDDEFVA